MSVPKFVAPVTPDIAEVPDFVIFPDASGVPAEGRTLTFCHVKEFVTPLFEADVMVKVICVVVREVMAAEVPLATPLMFRAFPPFPPVRVMRTVGAVPPVSKMNPDGALRIIVPTPAFPLAPSEYTGPVSVTYAPPVLSAEIADPPVAGVTDCAKLIAAGTAKSARHAKIRKAKVCMVWGILTAC